MQIELERNQKPLNCGLTRLAFSQEAGTPNEAWEMHSTNFGIDFDSYFRYFRRRAWTYGVEIADVRSFEAVSLYELRESPGFTVPQMCQKLKTTHQRILSATDKL
jgi:hypothetical protein